MASPVEDLLGRVRGCINRVIIDRDIIAQVGVYGVVIGNLIVRIANRAVEHRTSLIGEGRERGLVQIGRIFYCEAAKLLNNSVENNDAIGWNPTDHGVVREHKLIVVN